MIDSLDNSGIPQSDDRGFATLEPERALLARVFRQAPSFLALLRGSDHVFEYANDAFCRVARRADMVGKSLLEALPELRNQGFKELLDGVLATGVPYVGREIPVTLARGSDDTLDQVFVDFIYQPFTEADGTRSGVIVHGSDVTEQVRARRELEQLLAESEESRKALAETEQQSRTMLNALPTLAWTAKPDGYIDWYNSRWYEYTGTTPDDMAGWGWQSVHDPDALPRVLDRWRSSIATGQPFEMTFPLKGADGRFRPFLTRVSPITDSHGKVVRWFGTNTDVEAEHAAREAAERANQAKTQFLTTMSHELRTPLNAIAGYSELLEIGVHGPTTVQQREAINRIQRSQRHLLSLINDILNFAKLEAGHVEYAVASVSVRETIDAIEPLVAPQLGTKGLRFDRDGCADDSIVRADPEKVQQILINLLSNAIKFTEQGGLISMRCKVEDGFVAISVEDTGPGIPESQLERIFEPFVQIDRRLSSSHEGTGLGLAISRDLARGMSGELHAESVVGAGSVFRLRLPAAGDSA